MAWLPGVRGPVVASALVVALAAGAGAVEPSGEAPARAEEASPAAPPVVDDTGRLYFQFVTGMGFTLDKPFAGDVEIDGEPDLILGGGLGYNISRHWGVELQVQGGEPDLRSASRGKIREISIITVVPAARYRWHLLDDRLVPYVTGGVGMSFTDVNEDAKPFTRADTDSQTIVGSLSAGLDYFVSENVAVGVEGRYLIHPNQDAEVSFQAGQGGRVTRFMDELNLTGISLLAQLRFFPGQQAGPDGDRRLFLADHGPFDTDELRFYLAGLFGYDFLFDRSAGGGVKLRDKGGDANLSKGGSLGVNFDGHWGFEVQMISTPLNLRTGELGKIAEVNDTPILPTLRYRVPLLGGRLVPFLTAGLGVGYLIVNDPRVVVEVPTGRGGARQVTSPKWDPESPRIVGSVGAGVEYFLNRHLSVGLYVPVHMYQRTDTTVRLANGRVLNGTADFSGVLALLQLKAYLP
jgi:opacity protein-like surface antigen